MIEEERPIEEVQTDMRKGFLSPEAAARDYGVVVNADGSIDEGASTRR